MHAGGRIAVAGATGRVGRHVVGVLEARGREIVPMSRSSGVDVVSGDGLARALAGVECIVDTATGASPDQQAVLQQTASRFYAYRDRCPGRKCIADAYLGRMREIRDIMEGRWRAPR